MSSPLATFAFADNLVRVIHINDQPWWVASDIAKVLGYRDAANMIRMLDDDQKGTHFVSTLGGDQEANIINEGGMWMCVIKSTRKEAKQFQKWLTGELLPSLRRDGFYAMPGMHRREQLPSPARLRTMRDLSNAALKIGRAKSAPQREVIYAQMAEMASQLGQEIAPVEAFCPTQREDAEAAAIVERIDAMVASGMMVNRHRRAGLTAVWVKDLDAAGIWLNPALRAALMRHGRYKGQGPVNPSEGKTLTCWVFSAPA